MTPLYEGRFIQLVRRGRWEFVTRRGCSGVVAIIALTDQRELVLIEQHRPPVDCSVIELPAGLAGDIAGQEGEPLVEAAKRELLEETGYRASSWSSLGNGSVSAGLTDEQVEIFVARRLTKVGPGGGDESEDITVHLIPVSEIGPWLQKRRELGSLVDHKVLLAALLAEMPEDSPTLLSMLSML